MFAGGGSKIKNKNFFRQILGSATVCLFVFSGFAVATAPFGNSLAWARSDVPLSAVQFTEMIKDSIRGEFGAYQPTELRYIRRHAQLLGLRVWLYGGTAATFAHYIRDNGIATTPYRFKDLFKPKQDFDLIVDGPVEATRELARRLMQKFPLMRGPNSRWDIAHLRETYNNRMPILNNKDYINQNSDSLSTGLIEVTDTPEGEPLIRDSYHWDQNGRPFIEDVRLGKITFYEKEDHMTTSRYKAGLNPMIISVVRYLSKVFQYGAKMSPEDLEKINTIVENFDPEVRQHKYVMNWFKHNIRKLIAHAKDPEAAIKFLEDSGLKEKIIQMGDPNDKGSASWILTQDCSSLLR